MSNTFPKTDLGQIPDSIASMLHMTVKHMAVIEDSEGPTKVLWIYLLRMVMTIKKSGAFPYPDPCCSAVSMFVPSTSESSISDSLLGPKRLRM